MMEVQDHFLGKGEIIRQNIFRIQTLYRENNLLKIQWLEKSTELSDIEFWDELNQVTDTIRQYNIRLLLVDCQQLHYTIPPQQQHLIAEKFSGLWADAGLLRFASVHSEQLSVTASFEGVAEYAEDIGPVRFSYRFFEQMDVAIRWLLGL